MPLTSRHRAAGARARAGVTFLEILVATAIVAVALVPIFRGFHGLTTSVTMTRDRMTALLLAQSILETMRFRLLHLDSRYYTLLTPDEEISRRVEEGRWRDFFASLAHERRGVVSSGPLPVSTYFATFARADAGAAHGFLPRLDPAFCALLARFSCEVKVEFQNPAGEIIDPDEDGKPAYDMAWVTIVVTWSEGQGDAPAERSLTLSTILAEPTYSRAGG